MLWKYNASAPTLLPAPTGTNPLTGTAYSTFSNVNGINDHDYSVGITGSSSGSSTGNALLWDPNGNVTDLNTPYSRSNRWQRHNGRWVSLIVADAVSNDGWISGVGVYYDPNGSNYSTGALGSVPGEYYRPFLLQDAAAVPEPASLGVIAVAAAALISRRRRKPTGCNL